MALPIKYNNTQAGCNPVASNCVIWQGPDIPCIGLCHGDTISDVIAKLAEELCTILEYLDITNYDLSCFNPVCPTLENFQDLVQLIINRICSIEEQLQNQPAPAENGCPDCVVTIASCFYYLDPLGNQTTTMQLSDYVTAIGNRICQLVTEITTINGSITDIYQKITNIENQINTPTNSDKTFFSCLRAVPPSGYTVAAQLQFVEEKLCELLDSTGDPTELLSAISNECAGLDAELSLSTNVPMSTLPNWIPAVNYNTVADAITNMWITICDIRTALADLQVSTAACCEATCDDIVLTATPVFSKPTLTMTYGVTLPGGYSECAGGSTLIIEGSNGVTTVINGYNIINGSVNTDLSVYPVYHSLYYNITVQACYSNGTNTCIKYINLGPIAGGLDCPSILWSNPSPGIGEYSFTTSASTPTTYNVVIINETQANAVIGVASFSGSTPTTYSGVTTVAGDPGDSISMQITIIQGAYAIVCSVSKYTLPT